MRYLICFSYKGTNYHGWQIQPNEVTVQSVLTSSLSLVLRQEVELVGAGRTDAGVHAKRMFAHFDFDDEIVDFESLSNKLNSLLPPDISVFGIERVADDFHARFDAKSRTYRYYISRRKNPFLSDLSAKMTFPLDVDRMNDAAMALFDYTDFTSFSKVHTDVKTNNCKIMRAEWMYEEDCLVFTIQADRFLRNMVRAIVGTMLEVGKGKLSVEGFRKIIEQKNRCLAGTSAPAEGLFLCDVEY